jgi:hypothetical protein
MQFWEEIQVNMVRGLEVRVEEPRMVHLVVLEQYRCGESLLRTHQREG